MLVYSEDWSSWSSCNVLCGSGNNSRTRVIESETVEEKRSCIGEGDCSQQTFADSGKSCNQYCSEKGLNLTSTFNNQ